MKSFLKIIGLVILLTTFGFTNPSKKTVVIDVSHGGKDAGQSFGNKMEKEIVLNIAQKIKELNKNSNIDIILTRDADEFIGLSKRSDFINDLKPELVISIHANSSIDEELSGTEIYISDQSKEKAKSKEHALEMKKAFQEQEAILKKANFFLLREVNYPIVLLEVGYLSNKNDRALITTDKGQTEIAKNILALL